VTPVDQGVQQRDSEQNLLTWAAAIAVTVLICATLIVYICVQQFWQLPLSGDPGSWGQIGDFIGGLINPIVGLGTVLLIFISIQIQRSELRATTKQLDDANKRSAKQNFEQSFFSWLSTYRELLNAMQAEVIYEQNKIESFNGRKLLSAWYDTKLKLDDLGVSKCFMPAFSENDDRVSRLDQQMYFASHIRNYQSLFKNNRSELDAYLRTLYRLFQWIDGHTDLLPLEKFHYAALVRAQLSWVELAFLFYNGLTKEGEAFRRFYERYAIFDNIETGKDLLIDKVASGEMSHRGLLEDGPCQPIYSYACFSSKVARQDPFFAAKCVIHTDRGTLAR
jgi:uncharacterized membrane protein